MKEPAQEEMMEPKKEIYELLNERGFDMPEIKLILIAMNLAGFVPKEKTKTDWQGNTCPECQTEYKSPPYICCEKCWESMKEQAKTEVNKKCSCGIINSTCAIHGDVYKETPEGFNPFSDTEVVHYGEAKTEGLVLPEIQQELANLLFSHADGRVKTSTIWKMVGAIYSKYGQPASQEDSQ